MVCDLIVDKKRFKLTAQIAPKNIPLAPSAVLSPRIQPHLALAIDGEIWVVFPRSTPYAEIEKLKKKYDGEIYKCKVRVSYEVLDDNEYYDHSPLLSL